MKISSSARVHISANPSLEFAEVRDNFKNRRTMKPRGLWYGIGPSWINWIRSEEMSELEHQHLYEIRVNPGNVLMLDSPESIDAFHETYVYSDNEDFINWYAVKQDYSGIEVNPYFRNYRDVYDWYFSWEVASGCLWRRDAVGQIKLLSSDWS